MPLSIPGLRHDVPLAPLTTLGLGGPAALFLAATREAQLREGLVAVRASRTPLLVLGGGSNLVLPDAGFDGMVLQVATRGVRFTEVAGEVEVEAAAGEPWDDLVAETVRRGLGGIECLSGIPGLVGGTPIQNVGAYGQEVAECVRGVEVLDRRTLEVTTLPPAECGFAYRASRFKGPDADRFLVTRVRFALVPGAAPALRYRELADALADGMPTLQATRDAVLALRRRKGMVLDPADPDTRSAGSFFTNPVVHPEAFARLEADWAREGDGSVVPRFPANGGVKVPAAWLVERAGFARGMTVDGVGVSTKHALALVNRGGTTAALLRLVHRIQEGVEQRFGIRLVPEPVIIA